MAVTLNAHGYRLQLLPEYGATIQSATWARPDGTEIVLLAPLEKPKEGLQSGCFIMAPFVNRIADGRFTYAGKSYSMPLNRPEQGMAIHGFSRERAWQVVEAAPDQVILRDEVSSEDHPWRYTITMDVLIRETGIRIAISLRNDGAEAMPFGMGLHPFIPCDADTIIAFAAKGAFSTDSKGLPIGPLIASDDLAAGEPVPVQAWRGTDRCYQDWQNQMAQIRWPKQGCTLHLSADGAFKHLHVFVPTARDVVCVEPVSHFPDVINRPHLGSRAGMTVLERHATLHASMNLKVECIA